MKRLLNKLATISTVMSIVIGSSVVYGEEHDQEPAMSHERTFENPDDNMYYSVFGEGFEFMQEHSKQVNTTTNHDGLHMEILSTVSVQLDDMLRSFTFFTLQDETGDRVNRDMRLNLSDQLIENGWGNAWLLNFDETTQTATFVAEIHHFGRDEHTEHNNVSILIESILADNIFIDEIIDNVDIAYLLDSHNATFTRNETAGVSSSFISSSLELDELGLDFDTISEGETLTKDELRIPMGSYTDGYISNIALVDDMLHVQTNTSHGYDLFNWHSLDLVNTETGEIIAPLYNVRLDNYDEDFNLIDDIMYEESVFLIQDVNNLSNYAFNLKGSYFDTFIETDLAISFLSPILMGEITVNEEPAQVLISDKEIEINNIFISLLGIQFNLRSDELLNEDVDIFYMFDLISDNLDITLIYDDGTQQEYIGTNNMMGHGEDEDFISVSIGGQVIDVDRLVAINVNGTNITVK